MKLICTAGCGEVHSAGIQIPPGVVGNMLCVAKGDPLNIYYIKDGNINQYLKLTCPRCGQPTVVIVDTDPAVYGDTTTTIRESQWIKYIKNAIWR